MLQLPLLVELAAVVVGALSGAIHAVGRKADAVGTFAIALASSVGGGMIRDALIGQGPAVVLTAPLYLPAVGVVSLIALLFASTLAQFHAVLTMLDALLLGLWTVMGAERAMTYRLPPAAVVFLGTVTATGGGVLRDLLAGEPPAAFRKGELYITAAFIAALVYVALVRGLGLPARVAELTTIAVACGLRLAALRWQLHAPEPFDLPGWWRRTRQRRRSGS